MVAQYSSLMYTSFPYIQAELSLKNASYTHVLREVNCDDVEGFQ